MHRSSQVVELLLRKDAELADAKTAHKHEAYKHGLQSEMHARKHAEAALQLVEVIRRQRCQHFASTSSPCVTELTVQCTGRLSRSVLTTQSSSRHAGQHRTAKDLVHMSGRTLDMRLHCAVRVQLPLRRQS